MSRKRVGLITTLGGDDASHMFVSEEDYRAVLKFEPKDKDGMFSSWEYADMVFNYFYDSEKDTDNEKVLHRFHTQTFSYEDVDFSEYEIIGILTLSA